MGELSANPQPRDLDCDRSQWGECDSPERQDGKRSMATGFRSSRIAGHDGKMVLVVGFKRVLTGMWQTGLRCFPRLGGLAPQISLF
jgi:hypothetical protein